LGFQEALKNPYFFSSDSVASDYVASVSWQPLLDQFSIGRGSDFSGIPLIQGSFL
jgi:hypothetical protein